MSMNNPAMSDPLAIKAAVSVLNQSVTSGDLPLGVAMIANSEGVLFQHATGAVGGQGQSAVTTDSIFAIASMTKLITTIAALQLVEAGALKLDEPISTYLPALKDLQVLVGFNGDEPIYAPSPRAPSARELITHTSGFVYPMWNANALTAQTLKITPGLGAGRDSINAPLGFAPGTHMEYGISTDWLGVLVEQLSGQALIDYFEVHIFAPLNMQDTFYDLPEAKAHRALPMALRTAEGLVDAPIYQPKPSEKKSDTFYGGGAGLFSTVHDYTQVLRALLRDGALDGQRILQAETVDAMFDNHIGELTVAPLATEMPMLTNDIDMGFGSSAKWGLGFLLHTHGTNNGRSAGSASWGGLFNSYFWIDRERDICGVYATQLLPFFDGKAIETLQALERIVYGK